jgi:hypothetical protein
LLDFRILSDKILAHTRSGWVRVALPRSRRARVWDNGGLSG